MDAERSLLFRQHAALPGHAHQANVRQQQRSAGRQLPVTHQQCALLLGLCWHQHTKEELELLPAKKKQKSEGQEGLLKLVAGTLAYFKVASKRVIDGVPMHLKHFLLQRYCTELDELLVKRAAADSSNAAGAGGRVGAHESAAGSAAGVGDADVLLLQQQQPTAEQLMAEDASTADMRAQLKRQLEQLHNVRRILERF